VAAGDHAVGIVGAGSIIEHAHLPAYRAMGLPVRGIYDVDQARAQALAESDKNLAVASSLDALFEDPAIDVIDIAVPPDQQVVIAQRAIQAGKHLLCQKPLARTLDDARGLVSAAEAGGVKLAVNQQMRWDPLIAATERELREGRIGRPTAVLSVLNWSGDWAAGHWTTREPRGFALFNTVHFLDTLRHLFGEPTRLTGQVRSDPLQTEGAERWVNVWLEWEDGLEAVLFHRGTNWAGDTEALWRVEGTKGAIRGQFGIYDAYPPGRPDHGERYLYQVGRWETIVEGRSWIPDAFSGPMTSLLASIESGLEPVTSGRDNLKTLALVEATYESAASSRTVVLNPHIGMLRARRGYSHPTGGIE
jgi:predicted dehydrogenase